MEKLTKIIKVLGYLDYAVSASFLAYGLYYQEYLYAAAGVLGLGIAYLKPAERLKTKLQSKFIRKQVLSGLPAAEEAVVVSPAATPVISHATYLPRTRYSGTRYFINYYAPRATHRERVLAPRDAVAVLRAPKSRPNVGVRATGLQRRPGHALEPAAA